MATSRAAALRGGSTLNQKDLKRFKKILEESKKSLLMSARKTLTEEAAFDTDDLPDEIDLACRSTPRAWCSACAIGRSSS